MTMTANGTSSGLADPQLLRKIDRLFECNVGNYIDLPQLVVVGDQSSGKSSVLEGITGLPFPRDSGLCTRFATQITFRRAPVDCITVSIIPAKEASLQHAATVSVWQKADLHNLDSRTFAAIMQEAQQVMGIVGSDGKTSTFSEDVLKLELSGPSHEHLSVVDVPGIFKRTTDGVTTKEDIKMVRNMVLGYMNNPRSLLLAVVPANVDIATQEILEMADEVDKEKFRTMGILTKPDLVDRGAENAVIDLLEGKRQSLKLGWHVVRNPGQADLDDKSTDRDAVEARFFKETQPWAKLEKDKVGIASLKLRLQEVLAGHVRREFPKVRSELQARLKNCRNQLSALGSSRETTADKTKYLLTMAGSFQELTYQALTTEYAGDEVFERSPNLKIATLVRNRSEFFARVFDKYAHTYEFEGKSDDQPDPEPAKKLNVRLDKGVSDLEDIIGDIDDDVEMPLKGKIFEWLKELHHNSRGFELGTYQPSILSNSMKKQSLKWETLAIGYLSDIITMVHKFVVDMLEHVCPEKSVRQELMVILSEQLVAQYTRALDHVKFLLQVECAENPGTMNQYFATGLHDSRQRRHEHNATNDDGTNDGSSLIEQLKALLLSSDYNIQEIHDILKSYYHIARERFVDNCYTQAVGHFLVTGRDTPLKLFSSNFVTELSEQQLEDIAGEEAATKRKRKQLEKEIVDLENGRKVLH